MIRTVLNDIEKEKLGVTLCHEHFIVDLDRVRHDGISMIETPEEVEPEIRKMMALGVQAAVEVSTIDLGRDVRKLKQISLDTGLTIVASTGFYLTQYHPEWLASASAAAIDPANWPSWMERRPQPAIQPAGTPREASTGQSAHSTM